jgi:hypothetical protein
MSNTHSLIVLATIAIVIRLLFVGRRPKNYPPGPPTIPILGNIHLVVSHNLLSCLPLLIKTQSQMPTRNVHLQLQKWAKEYGPVYSLVFGTKILIVLSSGEAVKELLDRRSGIYSHRQEMYIGQTLASGGLRLLMMVSAKRGFVRLAAVLNCYEQGYGPKWRSVR